MAHSLGFLPELIQLPFLIDTGFGLSVFLTRPVARGRICASVIEPWHRGEADDRAVALHSFGNFDTPKLNLLSLVQSLVLFDAI